MYLKNICLLFFICLCCATIAIYEINGKFVIRDLSLNVIGSCLILAAVLSILANYLQKIDFW